MNTFKQFLQETSGLNQTDLGLTSQEINKIHSALKLSHDATFIPVSTKIAAKEAIDSSKVVVAKNPDGEVVSIAYYASPMRSKGIEVLVTSSNNKSSWPMVMSLTDGLKYIKPKAKIFASSDRGVHLTKHARGTNYNYGEPFIEEITRRFDNPLKKKAKALLPKAKELILNKLDDSSIKSKDFALARDYVKVIGNIAENGISAFRGGGWRPDSELNRMMRRFFNVVYDYELDSRIEYRMNDEKMVYEKFAKTIFDNLTSYYDEIKERLSNEEE